jgi:hypothetical protein
MNSYKNSFRNVLMALLGGAMLAISACKKEKDDEPVMPKFKIVELPFGSALGDRPTVDQIQAALNGGADSVYLVSKEDFDLITDDIYFSIASTEARDLTALSPRVSGNNTIINPTQKVAEEVNPVVIDKFKAAKFRVVPGYVKTK